MEVSSLFPALGTLSAALVTGGLALATLIVSKESKISEFRHGDTGALRDEIAKFLASARTMARAAQESRLEEGFADTKFYISSAKISEIRHEAAETFSKILLRIYQGQPEQKNLVKLLRALINEQNIYLQNFDADIAPVFDAIEKATEQASVVLNLEWSAVKEGEAAYRRALKFALAFLSIVGGLLLALAIGVPVYTSTHEKNREDSSPTALSNVGSSASMVPEQLRKQAPDK